MSKLLLTKHAAGERISRHRHVEPYAAVVLEGAYVEAGDGGRFAVEAGHVILHAAFEAHSDAFAGRAAVVLNLPVRSALGSTGRIADPDLIVRLAERDTVAACSTLLESLVAEAPCCTDWPDQLGQCIIRDPTVALGKWADHFGIAPQSLSRGFVKAYGVTPKRFRADQRALRAIRMLAHWQGTGANLAATLGFTDQAHMIKAIKSISGRRPAEVR